MHKSTLCVVCHSFVIVNIYPSVFFFCCKMTKPFALWARRKEDGWNKQHRQQLFFLEWLVCVYDFCYQTRSRFGVILYIFHIRAKSTPQNHISMIKVFLLYSDFGVVIAPSAALFANICTYFIFIFCFFLFFASLMVISDLIYRRIECISRAMAHKQSM